ISVGGYFTSSQVDPGNPPFGSLRAARGIIPTYTSLADENGVAVPLYNNYRQGYIDTLGSGRLLDWRFYPLNDHQYVNTSTKLTDYTATVGAKYDLFKNLNVDFKYRFGRQQSDNRSLFTEQSYFARD